MCVLENTTDTVVCSFRLCVSVLIKQNQCAAFAKILDAVAVMRAHLAFQSRKDDGLE
jgi:hypothetical protein